MKGAIGFHDLTANAAKYERYTILYMQPLLLSQTLIAQDLKYTGFVATLSPMVTSPMTIADKIPKLFMSSQRRC